VTGTGGVVSHEWQGVKALRLRMAGRRALAVQARGASASCAELRPDGVHQDQRRTGEITAAGVAERDLARD